MPNPSPCLEDGRVLKEPFREEVPDAQWSLLWLPFRSDMRCDLIIFSLTRIIWVWYFFFVGLSVMTV
jgi:hypothetical protein